MSKLNADEYKAFEDIKQVNEDGTEVWYARELASVLQYTQWRNFSKVIDRATLACKNSGFEVSDHFAEVSKMIEVSKGANRKTTDFILTRYGYSHRSKCLFKWQKSKVFQNSFSG